MNIMNLDENPELETVEANPPVAIDTENPPHDMPQVAPAENPENFPYASELATPVEHPILSVSPLVLMGAFKASVDFLDLADLDPVATVSAIRGTKEAAIRDKIQSANSMLVLLSNYGSETDNEELVTACTAYAEKMKVIIKRLCL